MEIIVEEISKLKKALNVKKSNLGLTNTFKDYDPNEPKQYVILKKDNAYNQKPCIVCITNEPEELSEIYNMPEEWVTGLLEAYGFKEFHFWEGMIAAGYVSNEGITTNWFLGNTFDDAAMGWIRDVTTSSRRSR